MLRSPPLTRRGQVAAYLLFAGAGATAGIFSSPSVETTASNRALVALWVVFLVAGGLSSAGGRLMSRWAGEFVGLPLLGTAFLIYTVSILYTTVTSGRYTGFPAGLALAAIFALVATRWFEVNQIRLEAVKEARARSGPAAAEDERAPDGRDRKGAS